MDNQNLIEHVKGKLEKLEEDITWHTDRLDGFYYEKELYTKELKRLEANK